MRKIFLATFGGTPARGELCLYLNAAAGLYQNCGGIQSYPIDKDVKSPNYINTRNMYNQYQSFHEIVKDTDMASVDIVRTEAMFEDMLREADINSENESIRYLMSRDYGLNEQDQRLLNICYTEEEQDKPMKGGYYGRANIGSVTGDILIHKGIYEKLNLCRDIGNALKAGTEVDVVVICSSFGGTGASLGINFGKYLKQEYGMEAGLRIHCIYIQPYFRFPDPDNDEWGMDYRDFYAKSATVISILGYEKSFIKENENDENAVFDRFYYLGQETLDQTTDKNSARSGQDNHIHLVDMLVSLAVQDILMDKEQTRPQLYGYQYANEGTNILSWRNMPFGIGFKTKHVCMMRFCEFMLDCMEPLFDDGYSDYEQEILIIWLYGSKSLFDRRADINDSIKTQLHGDMQACFEFCRNYIKYWIELEESTRFGNEQTNVTRFFNLSELKRILSSRESGYADVRLNANSLKLTETEAYDNYEKGNRCLNVYDRLCKDKRLKGIAKPGKDKHSVARTLVRVIYEECAVENYKDQRE